MLAHRQARSDRHDLSVSVKVYFLRCRRRDSQMLFAAAASEQTSLNTAVYWGPRLFYLPIHAAVKLICV
jgi:hypothetical protein